MAVVVKHYSNTGQATQKQIQNTIQQRQLLNVMDYVLQNSYKTKIKIDPRYQAILQQKQDQENQKIMAMAKKLAEQVGKSINFNNQNKSTASTKEQSKTVEQGKYAIQQQPYQLQLAEQSYQITIKPGNALPALNNLSKKKLQTYLQNIGLTNTKQLAAVITDWQDEDQITQDKGAETGTGKHQQNYRPANKLLQSWQELYHLKGINAAVIKKMQQHLVLNSTQKKINKDYASPKTIAALANVTEKTAKQWLGNEQEKSIQFDKEKQKITQTTGKEIDKTYRQITIKTNKQSLQLRYNWEKQTIINWQFKTTE